jgi:4-hydroxy-2-oxoheptanedioate aldolase
VNNPVRQVLSAGQPSVGSWLNLGSPMAAEVLAAAGYSWLCVDAEHSPYDMESIAHMLRAIESRGALPLVRAWDHAPETAAPLLDAGARGICFPHVSTAEQAARLGASMRYPPRGTRSIGSGRANTLAPGYRHLADDDLLCIVQIEDMEGIRQAEAIAALPDVDIGFLGPTDLAASMGVEPGHPEHEAALQAFRQGCAAAGTPSGIPAGDGDTARKRIAEGFQFIDLANDVVFLEGAAREQLSRAQDDS